MTIDRVMLLIDADNISVDVMEQAVKLQPDSAEAWYFLGRTYMAQARPADAAKAFEKSKQLIRDDLLSYLSGLKVADTLGAESKDKIRDELQAAVAEVIGEDRVHRVVFIEFVVQ